MDSWDTEYLIEIADRDMEGYELLSLISHMSIYASGSLTKSQQALVDEVEHVLAYIYVRDQLDDLKQLKASLDGDNADPKEDED